MAQESTQGEDAGEMRPSWHGGRVQWGRIKSVVWKCAAANAVQPGEDSGDVAAVLGARRSARSGGLPGHAPAHSARAHLHLRLPHPQGP